MRRTKRTNPIKHRSLWVLCVVFLVAASFQLAARAGLLTTPIVGSVTDILGSPIAGVTVSDGYQSVSTNEEGRFTIEENTGSGFTLTANKIGYSPRSRSGTAIPGTEVNFSLLFALDVAITPEFLNSVPHTVDLIVWSLAPADSILEASFNQVSTQPTFVETISGRSKWTSSFSLQESKPDGSYPLTVGARKEGQPVATSIVRNVVLDRVLPSIGEGTVIPPGSHHLETFSGVPTLSVPLSDDRSKIDSARLTFTVSNSGGQTYSVRPAWNGQVASHSFSDQSISAGTWLWEVEAFDKSGNRATRSFTFVAKPLIPFIDSPPSLAISGLPVSIKGVVPFDSSDVKLRVQNESGVVEDVTMTATGRTYSADIPGRLVVDGIVYYAIVAQAPEGSVQSGRYRLHVGQDPNPNGLVPYVRAVSSPVAIAPWGGGAGQVGLERGDEAATLGPVSFAIDHGLNRAYILDNANSRIVGFGVFTGTQQLAFSIGDKYALDIAIIPQLGDILVLLPDAVVRYNSAGQLVASVPVPSPPRFSRPTCVIEDHPGSLPMVNCSEWDPGLFSLSVYPTPNGGWSAYVSGGPQNRFYPVYVDGTHIDPATAFEQSIPGAPVPMMDGLYAAVSMVNGSAMLGLVQELPGGIVQSTIIPLPPLPNTGLWIPDSLGEISLDASFLAGNPYSFTQGTRIFVPVGMHKEDGQGNITASEWQLFGIELNPINATQGIGAALVLGAEITDQIYAPHSRVFYPFTAASSYALYQMTSDGAATTIRRWNWATVPPIDPCNNPTIC